MSTRTFSLMLCVCALVGCSSPTEKSLSASEYQELLQQTIFPLPDSSLTKEQIELKVKVLDLLNKGIYMEDNSLKLSVEKEVFEKEDIPAHYHDVLLYQLKETNEAVNRWIKEGKIPAHHLNQDSLIKIAKERYWSSERPLLIERLEK